MYSSRFLPMGKIAASLTEVAKLGTESRTALELGGKQGCQVRGITPAPRSAAARFARDEADVSQFGGGAAGDAAECLTPPARRPARNGRSAAEDPRPAGDLLKHSHGRSIPPPGPAGRRAGLRLRLSIPTLTSSVLCATLWTPGAL